MRRIPAFTILSLLILALLPAQARAEGGTSNIVYLPLAMSMPSEPGMIQFRSCGGYNNVALQFKEVHVGPLSALSEGCEGGDAYPEPISEYNQGVALGGYYWPEYNWHVVPHIGRYYDVDVQFHVNFGIGGAPPPYLSVNVREGKLNVFRGDEVYTSTTTVDGWTITFHPEASKPYVQFQRDQNIVWIVLDELDLLWVEVRISKASLSAVSDSGYPAWGTWHYALTHDGQLPPSLQALEEYIIARYDFD